MKTFLISLLVVYILLSIAAFRFVRASCAKQPDKFPRPRIALAFFSIVGPGILLGSLVAMLASILLFVALLPLIIPGYMTYVIVPIVMPTVWHGGMTSLMKWVYTQLRSRVGRKFRFMRRLAARARTCRSRHFASYHRIHAPAA